MVRDGPREAGLGPALCAGAPAAAGTRAARATASAAPRDRRTDMAVPPDRGRVGSGRFRGTIRRSPGFRPGDSAPGVATRRAPALRRGRTPTRDKVAARACGLIRFWGDHP